MTKSNLVRCCFCGKTFARAPQNQREQNVCPAHACQRQYFSRKQREWRARCKAIEGQHPPSQMTVLHDPSGCFDKGVKLIAVVQSVRMGCLPPGLMLTCSHKVYRVEGEECKKETLVQIK